MQKREVDKSIYTTAAKANAGGNAQANIKIIPNYNANSKKSAKQDRTMSVLGHFSNMMRNQAFLVFPE